MGSSDDPSRPELTNYVSAVQRFSTIRPEILFEAGTKDGKDSIFLAQELNIPHQGVYLFEPNQMLYKKLEQDTALDQMNKIPAALYNQTCQLKFYEALNSDDGRSSLLDRPEIYSDPSLFKVVQVDAIRLDEFMESKSIDFIDLFKLDVEGATMEVLEGAGTRLQDIKSFQIEAEYYQIWESQSTWREIKYFLEYQGFVQLVEINHGDRQCDSVWIQKEFAKGHTNG
jgi:FkbM family methyltransferase